MILVFKVSFIVWIYYKPSGWNVNTFINKCMKNRILKFRAFLEQVATKKKKSDDTKVAKAKRKKSTKKAAKKLGTSMYPQIKMN